MVKVYDYFTYHCLTHELRGTSRYEGRVGTCIEAEILSREWQDETTAL